MADFCKQCSIELFGEPSPDLADLLTLEEESQGLSCKALCEGCGFISIDNEGNCLTPECLRHGHNLSHLEWLSRELTPRGSTNAKR